MKLLAYLKELVEDFAAWRRGEKRVVPHGVRGRVYQRKKADDISSFIASGKYEGTIRPSGIFIASENQWYDIDEKGKRSLRKDR